MEKITELTEEQKAQFPRFVDKWTKIGLCTDKANRKEAEAGIAKAYEIAGMKTPKIFWCESPLAMLLAKVIALKLAENKEPEVVAGIPADLKKILGARLEDLEDVTSGMDASILQKVDEKIRPKLLEGVRESLQECVYGQHEAGWLSFYDYMRYLGCVEQTAKLEGIWKVAENAGWWLPCKSVCFISERHNVLNRDDQGRLHSTTAAAVAYPDGWAVYAVHGVRLPEYVILHPEQITVQDIESERNAEIRRVKIERYGQAKYLKDSKAIKVQEDDFGVLYRKDIPGDEALVMVKVINSTPEPDEDGKPVFKDYFLRVPPTVKTAHEGVAWTFGKTPETYNPEKES